LKKLIIALVLLIMITATAIAVLRWLHIGPFGGEESAASAQPEKPAAAEVQAYFVALDTILVPLLRDDKVSGTIQIQIKLEVSGEPNRDAALRAKPRLASAFFQELYGYIPRMLRTSDRLDIFVMKKRLQMVADKTLGQGAIQDVLIQSVTEVPAS